MAGIGHAPTIPWPSLRDKIASPQPRACIDADDPFFNLGPPSSLPSNSGHTEPPTSTRCAPAGPL
ncbi:hypothetical protein CFC21_001602 [Triticum aestivum]|uniref:Uncharacterized protein n=2 Tax=Triticum TaxID=4564 RepID=A0A3B5XY80_WHEAT|nr:hypothetical protein TRIUR3_28641 [Triticum urartu]KAF6983414.1 hypothetical protein CFC21_001602 [Triticum aestivum]